MVFYSIRKRISIMSTNKVMTLQKKSQGSISLVLNLVFVLYAMTFIVSSGLERLTIYLATVLWLLEGDFKIKFSKLFSQKVVVLYFAIIALFLLSVFMSDSITDGFTQVKYANAYSYIFHKNIVYFMMAVYMSTSIKKEFLQYVLYAFLLQVVYMTFNIYYLYFTQYIHGSDFTYFIMSTNRIFYSIALNIGLMLFINLYLKSFKKVYKIFIGCMMVLIIFAVLLLGSRAGVLALIINFLILVIYIGKKHANYKYMIAGIILSSMMFIMSYLFIPQVTQRINMAFSDLNKVYTSHNYNSSLGIRIGLYETSINLLFENKCSIVCGLGYGDAKLKFKNYLEANFPEKAFITKQPHVHNQYLQTWIDGGLLAMFLYIAILIVLFRLKIPHYDKLGLYGFVSSFAVLGLSDIIYHRGVVLGLFAFGIGLFLGIEQYGSKYKLKKEREA